jgi:hypothetical protein
MYVNHLKNRWLATYAEFFKNRRKFLVSNVKCHDTGIVMPYKQIISQFASGCGYTVLASRPVHSVHPTISLNLTESFEKRLTCDLGGIFPTYVGFFKVLLTAMTLAVPRRTNIPRPTKKDPKDTPDRVFNKLVWVNHYGTEGVCRKMSVLRVVHLY